MKILKPGKVEMRRFVCRKCGCEFVANVLETILSYIENDDERQVSCPCCEARRAWEMGEPYEEPTWDDRERLIALLDGNFGYTEEIPAETLADKLIANGVTFNELTYTLKYITRIADFELLNRLEVRDNRTGKIWR